VPFGQVCSLGFFVQSFLKDLLSLVWASGLRFCLFSWSSSFEAVLKKYYKNSSNSNFVIIILYQVHEENKTAPPSLNSLQGAAISRSWRLAKGALSWQAHERFWARNIIIATACSMLGHTFAQRGAIHWDWESLRHTSKMDSSLSSWAQVNLQPVSICWGAQLGFILGAAAPLALVGSWQLARPLAMAPDLCLCDVDCDARASGVTSGLT
jgi:hypothetical protein